MGNKYAWSSGGPGYNGAPSNVSDSLAAAGVTTTTNINKDLPKTNAINTSTDSRYAKSVDNNSNKSTITSSIATEEKAKGVASLNSLNESKQQASKKTTDGTTGTPGTPGTTKTGTTSTSANNTSNNSSNIVTNNSGNKSSTITASKKSTSSNLKASGTSVIAGNSSSGSLIKSLKNAKSQVKQFKMRITVYSSHIDALSEVLKAFMTGDGTNAFWQGEAAYTWCEKAIGSSGLKKIIANYKATFNEFKLLSKKIEKADLKNSLKGAKKSAVKNMLSQCTGSTYTSGVAAEKSDKNISAVLSTVNKDAVNDDQTNASYKTYLKLKKCLQDLITDYNELDKIESNIKSNTTGKLNADSQKRIDGNKARRNDINNLINTLEEEYIGDMLFSN